MPRTRIVSAFLALAFSCSATHKPIAPIGNIAPIKAKRLEYCDLSWPEYFNQAYVDGECDSLLFTSLRGIGCNDIDIEAFQGAAGQWFRSPTHDCLETHGADSDISKDMLLGLANYLWWSRDEKNANALIEYGLKHYWVMGRSENVCVGFTKCLMPPELINNFYNIRSLIKTGAPYSGRFVDTIFGFMTRKPQKGFLAHLEVLHILLNGSLYGYVTQSEYTELKTQATREPHNALFQAAWHLYSDGDQTIATALLMDESHFPSHKLPTNKNYCSGYLYQRDEAPFNWQPCDNEREKHYGTDLIFAAAVLDGTYMRGERH